MLDAFPYLPVTCVDILDYRVADVQTMYEGGLHQLNALQTDVTNLPFSTGQFEVVTMLEVKERYKYVRSSFLQAVFDTESHWQDRPVLQNQLRQDAALF